MLQLSSSNRSPLQTYIIRCSKVSGALAELVAGGGVDGWDWPAGDCTGKDCPSGDCGGGETFAGTGSPRAWS